MTTISYIISFIATILGLIEPFSKNMKTVLAFVFTGNLLVSSSYLLVGQKSGAVICLVACVQVFINYILGLKKIKTPIWLTAVYIVAFLSVNVLVFSHWYDVLSMIASILFVASISQSHAKYYRILYFLNSTVWILYDFFAKAYGNLSTHIILFAAILISIFVRDKNHKHN